MTAFTRKPRHPRYAALGSENTHGDDFLLCADDREFANTYYCGASYVRDGQRWASDGPAGLSTGHPTREDAEQIQIDAYRADLNAATSREPDDAPAQPSLAPLPTTYEHALAEAHERGVGKCSDSALMAAFCDGPLQILVGAVAPQLVWEGAQKSGMTTKDLGLLCNEDAVAVGELMWL
ncbi:hypothetical protein ACIBCO_37280 [Streptomyces violascens]|uniref:hypothetical protein n=1 Tax=Streptomyces violascens TaxID=67381 RepID=UPI00378BEB86